MTVQRAIKIMENAKHLFHFSCSEIDENTACDMALNALKKQMPQKPYYRKEEYAEGYACPVCDMGVTVDHGRIKDTFCSHCGQALDWGD